MKKIIFCEKELLTLLAVGNAKYIFIFEMSREISDQEIISSLHSLYKKEIIYEKDGKLELSKEISEILDAIKRAKQVIVLKYFEVNVPLRIIYRLSNSEILILEHVLSDIENYFKLVTMNTKDFVSELVEYELFEFCPGIKELAYLEEEFGNQSKGESPVCFEAAMYSVSDEKKISGICLKRTPLHYQIVRMEDGGSSTLVFMKNEFMEELFKLMETCK